MTTVSADRAEELAREYLQEHGNRLDFDDEEPYTYRLAINDKYILNFSTMTLHNVITKRTVKVYIDDKHETVKIRPSVYTIGQLINVFLSPHYGHDHNLTLSAVDSDQIDAKLTFSIDYPFISIYNAIFNYIHEHTKFEKRMNNHFLHYGRHGNH